tara:strand:- start:7093 stop:7902 length:810 start_codon:yes stop_codon:yes gene_type:complete
MAFDTQRAQYPSYQEFIAFTKTEDNHPSFANLFSVHFASPRILQNSGNIQGGSKTTNLISETGDLAKNLNFYCQSVNLPSKQVTTGAVTNVGAATKYATGTAYSQLNMTFIMPKSQYTRAYFERWVGRMAPDANQYVDFFDSYVCPSIRIYKFERGGGDLVASDPKMITALRTSNDFNKNTFITDFLLPRKYRITAMYDIRNAFPYNIGSVQLNNDTSRAMTLTVGFLYERYRVQVEQDFTDEGRFKHQGKNAATFAEPLRVNSGILFQ